MPIPLKKLALLLLTALIAGNAAAERFIETVGSATISNDARQTAKQHAIKDAMQQAMLQAESRVDSSAAISKNVLVMESSRVTAAGTVEDVNVLEEWEKDGIYFVRIRAQVPRHKLRKPSPAARYRKKIAALQFEIENHSQTVDLTDIERSLPREILRRLELTDQFITIDGSDYLVAKNPQASAKLDDSYAYSQIAEKLGAQIILSGIIRDAGVSKEWGIFKKRHLEIEIFLHDGLSGARIARHRISETVENAGWYKPGLVMFSQDSFYNSNYGRVFERVLQRQTELLFADMENIPFSARVVDIKNKQIYFDAGLLSQIKTGDVLMTYRLSPEPLNGTNGYFLGYQEEPVASMAVKTVQPHFSAGQLETDASKLYVGDIIRFGW